MSSASLIKTPPEKVRVNGWVFYTSTALILLLTAILIIAPQEAGRMLGLATMLVLTPKLFVTNKL